MPFIYNKDTSEILPTKATQKISTEEIESANYELSEGFWYDLCCNKKLNDEFIRKFYHKVKWMQIFLHQNLSEELLEDILKQRWVNKSLISVCIHQKLTDKLIRKFSYKFDNNHWNEICQHQILNEQIIEENIDKVNWVFISIYQELSENFIYKYWTKLLPFMIFAHQKLSSEFIDKIISTKGEKDIDWNYITKYQKLNEKFIKKYENKILWNYIWNSQTFSEEYIRELYNKANEPYSRISLNWVDICIYQKLSENFIREFEDKMFQIEFGEKVYYKSLWFSLIFEHQELSKEFKKEFSNRCYNKNMKY
jgi:hypothetical protein